VTYNPRNLSALSYANGFTLWHYKTADMPADVCKPGYFDDAHTLLKPGDLVLISAAHGNDGAITVIAPVRFSDHNGVFLTPIAGEETAP